MKIRITGAKKDTYWYADKIGETFESMGKDGISGGLLVVHKGVRDRYVVQPGDYEVVSDEAAPISGVTVLPDESLGGTLREYREVKRKAGVGERIVFDGSSWGITAKKPYTVVGGDGDGAEFVDDDGDTRWEAHITANCFVLEPTDILRIGSERFRMVDRKAAVGERVIIANPDSDAKDHGGYVPGDIATITCTGSDDYGTFYDARMTNGKGIAVYAKEYRVLEPVTTPAPLSTRPATLLSSRSYADQIAENIAALTAKVQALESRVAALEDERKLVKVASGPVDITPPSFVKSPQEIRDEIVERAKADVKALGKYHIGGPGKTLYVVGGRGPYTAEFVVNRDKRTVVCLLRLHGVSTVEHRGIAKCAPNDVFNAHIGKAISLRRALGLEVPAEYLCVPNPESVRVGDVIAWTRQPGAYYEVVRDRSGNRAFKKGNDVYPDDYEYITPGRNVLVIDDSREGADDSASSSTKGVAA